MYDAIIVSDLHLGQVHCKRAKLKQFLINLPTTKRLIINGDLIESTNTKLGKDDLYILSLLHKCGTELIWVKGNHDGESSRLALLIGASWWPQYSFISGDENVWVEHGHRFDMFLLSHPYLVGIGDTIYNTLRYMCPWLADRLKHVSKEWLDCVKRLRNTASLILKNYDIVCFGHTHYAEENVIAGYYNSGCWTDGCCYITIKDGVAKLEKYL